MRKSSAADSARDNSSKLADVDEVGQSSNNRASRRSSRLSSVNDNVHRNSSSGRSFVDVADDADRRRSSSVTSARRASRQQTEPSIRRSSTSRPSSRSSTGRKLSTMRARFSAKSKFSALKRKFSRRRNRSSRPSLPARSASTSQSSSSRYSRSSDNRTVAINIGRQRNLGDDDNETDSADNLVKPVAKYIASVIQKSVAKCDDIDDECHYCGQIRTVPHPPGYCYDGRCSTHSWNPRDRFSLCGIPFYRSGHRAFFGATRLRQSRGASVVAYGDRQLHSGNAEFVPDAQNAMRQASAGQVRSSSQRALVQNQDAAFISSMPPPGTSMPRPTITVTSRNVSAAAPRPPFAGYREHYVTTTNQTVRVAQDQNFNYTSNAAARRSLDDGYRGRTGANINRNQSGATSADHGASFDLLQVRDVAAMFEEAERGIMEAFDNAQQILQ